MDKSPLTFQPGVMETSTLREMDDRADVAYWRARPPEERFAALEFLRQQFYDYDPSTARISGFFEIVKPKR